MYIYNYAYIEVINRTVIAGYWPPVMMLGETLYNREVGSIAPDSCLRILRCRCGIFDWLVPSDRSHWYP